MKKLLIKLKNEDGQVLILFALILTVLMGVSALAVDIGRVTVTKSQLQNAADASALAAVAVSPDDAESTAQNYAKFNGVDHTDLDTTVEVSVNNVVGGETEFTTRKYNQDELDEIRNDLTDELNLKTDTEIISFAVNNSININSYLSANFKNDIERNNAINYIINKKKEAIETELNNELKTAEDIKLYASKNSIDISSFLKNGDFQNDNKRDNAKEFIINKEKEKVETELRVKLKTDAEIKSYAVENSIDISSYLNLNFLSDIDRNNAKKFIIDSIMTVKGNEEIMEADINENSTKVKVTCKKKISYTFARIIGFEDTIVTAEATAENASWAGDALPFLNMDDTFINKGDVIDVWESVAPGNKERIHDDVIQVPNNYSIKINIRDDNDGNGPYILMKGGFAVGSEIPTPLTNIVIINKTVYLYSLKNDLIDDEYYEDINNINKYKIPINDVVLLKCAVTSNWNISSKTVHLKYEESYTWNSVKKTFVTSTGENVGGSIKLIK